VAAETIKTRKPKKPETKNVTIEIIIRTKKETFV
jgi:hypothetical protein